MIYIYLAPVIILIVGTHGNAKETGQISFVAESKFIQPGSTKSLNLKCSLPEPMKDKARIMFLSISKEGDDTKTKSRDLAGISFQDGLVKIDHDLKAEIGGDISKGTTGHLEILWTSPENTVDGTYVCLFVFLDNSNGTKLLTSKVKADFQSAVMDNLVKRLNTFEEDARRNLKRLTGQLNSVEGSTNKNFTSLKGQILRLKGSDLRMYNLISNLKKSLFWVSEVWNDHQYYLSHFKQEGGAARYQIICQGLGGYLMESDSEEEFLHVVNFINAYPDAHALKYMRVSVGGTDAATEGKWLTSSGKRVGYIKWTTGKPHDDTNRNCLEISPTTKLFDDYNCLKGYNHHFLCEVPSDPFF